MQLLIYRHNIPTIRLKKCCANYFPCVCILRKMMCWDTSQPSHPQKFRTDYSIMNWCLNTFPHSSSRGKLSELRCRWNLQIVTPEAFSLLKTSKSDGNPSMFIPCGPFDDKNVLLNGLWKILNLNPRLVKHIVPRSITKQNHLDCWNERENQSRNQCPSST